MQENAPYLLTVNDLVVGNPNAKPPQKPLLPISKEKLRQLINAKDFPAPLKIGTRNYWRPEDVQAWKDKKANEAKGRAK